MTSGSGSPVVALAFDAAEPALLDRLVAEGRMPNLARLRAAGASLPLVGGDGGGLMGAVWQDFVTAKPLGEHGHYFFKCWRPEHMRVEFADPSWLRLRPFWRDRPRMALIDVPYLDLDEIAGGGLVVSGWQAHDFMPRRSHPTGLLAEWEERFGPPPLSAERYGPQDQASLLGLRKECLAATEQIGRIADWLLTRERYDLFLLVLGAPHRAGHYLWDLTQVGGPDAVDPAARPVLEGALEDIYAACDRALGMVLNAAPSDARILVFALHGMGPNPGWNEFLDPVDRLACSATDPAAARSGGARALLRRGLKSPIGRAMTRRIPGVLQRRLTPLWTAWERDWSGTRLFSVPSNVAGCLRLNRAGRESSGCVRTNAEAEELLAAVTERLMGLRELASGLPIVRRVHRTDAMTGTAGPARDQLPDLMVEWTDTPATGSTGLVAADARELRWPQIASLPSGRSGNHRPKGWATVAAPGVAAGSALAPADILAIPATLCAWLGMAASGADHAPLVAPEGDEAG